MTQLMTLELAPGDRVLIDGRLVRTIKQVRPNGYLNHRDEPLYSVEYAEGDTPEWSGGNGAAGDSWWKIVTPCACDFCDQPAHHIDAKGYVYCDAHKISGRGRKLTRAELARLERGDTVERY